MALNARQLQFFRHAAALGSFAAAARVLGVSHQAISKQICALERDIGTPLFRRTRGRLTLTESGRVLLQRAEIVTEQVRLAEEELQHLKQGGRASRVLRLALYPSLMGLYIAEELPRRMPPDGQRLDVQTSVVQDPWPLIYQRQVDAVVALQLPGDTPPSANVRVVPLLVEPTWIALSAQHPLADRDSVTLSELAHDNWIVSPAGHPLRTFLEQGCHAAGFAPRIVHETTSFALFRELVRSNKGVTLCAPIVPDDDGYRTLPLRDQLTKTVVVAYRGSPNQEELRLLPGCVVDAYRDTATRSHRYSEWLATHPEAILYHPGSVPA